MPNYRRARPGHRAIFGSEGIVARNQLYFNEYEDVLASTDLLAIVAPGLRKQPSNWKWMILAAHNGLQGALVCAIQDTSATNILNKDSETKMLNYLEKLDGDQPQEFLADRLRYAAEKIS